MTALVGVLLVGLGCVTLLAAIVSRCGAYVGRAVVLFCVGGLALYVESHGALPFESFLSSGTCSERLVSTRRERNALYRSLRADVLPLIERCNRELRQANPALPENEAVIARQHAFLVLAEAEVRRCEHERAIAELDAAIGVMERDHALTQVKPAERGSAMARTTLFDVRPTTQKFLEQ